MLWGRRCERAGRLVSGGVHLLDVQAHGGLWNFQESKSGPERPRKIESVLKSVLQAKRNPAETQCFCVIFVAVLNENETPLNKRDKDFRLYAVVQHFSPQIMLTERK